MEGWGVAIKKAARHKAGKHVAMLQCPGQMRRQTLPQIRTVTPAALRVVRTSGKRDGQKLNQKSVSYLAT